jgi:hypothetical protein
LKWKVRGDSPRDARYDVSFRYLEGISATAGLQRKQA